MCLSQWVRDWLCDRAGRLARDEWPPEEWHELTEQGQE